MRTVAHTTLMVCCLLAAPLRSCPAEERSTWRMLGQAKIEKKDKNLSATVFRPELSLEENNRLLAMDRAATTTLALTVPTHARQSSIGRSSELVNRRIQLDVAGLKLSGRVTAVMLAPSQQATIFAQFENDRIIDSNRVFQEETGVLSIGE